MLEEAAPTYAWVADGVITNVICWDGRTEFDLPEGVALVPLPTEDRLDPQTGETVPVHYGGIGWSYADGEFVDTRFVEIEEP